MKKTILFFISSLLLTFIFLSCGGTKGKQNQQMQNFNKGEYQADWKEIDSLYRQMRQPQSALEKLEKLCNKIQKDNNPAEYIKCIILKNQIQMETEEEGFAKGIVRLQNEIETNDFPVKPVLQSILAKAYATYLNNNQWRIQNRTTTIDFKPRDLKTWTIAQLLEETNKYYFASLEDDRIKNVPIDNFDVIISEGKFIDGLRPTLFDLLAHRALDHFIQDNSHLTEPVYKFYLNQKEAFADANTFANFVFQTKDENSSKFKALQLFQRLIKAHLEDAEPNALLDVNLKRLKYAYDNSVLDEKQALYISALEKLETKYSSNPVSTEVVFERAKIYRNRGNAAAKANNPDHQWDLKKAFDLCQEAIDKYPKSYGAEHCLAMQSQLLQKNLALQIEDVNLPNENSLALISYRNVNKIFLRIIKVDEKQYEKIFTMRRRDKDSFLRKLDPQKSWSLDLPKVGDYRNHNVEIKIDPLPVGRYLILASDNEDFKIDQHTMIYVFTQVSNISHTYKDNQNGENEFVLMHRKTGEPLANVTASFYFRKNYKDKAPTFIGEELSNDDGIISTKKLQQQKSFIVKFKKGDDFLAHNQNYRNYNRNNSRRTQQQTHFFLDRAIYRPGQTVFFKGFLIEKDEEQMPRILPNKTLTITLKDVNYQDVETATFTSNEYGTFHGSFTLPKGRLLGHMQLHSSINGSKGFRVEEYKRPKFEVNFDPVKGAYRLGDEVKVEGNAKAFAGSNIDGAKVNYRVVREVRYPYVPWWFWRGHFPQGNNMEITNGETTTDAEGKFEVKFKAEADLSIAKDKKPEFTYTVYADVIDITGETHASSTNVKVGYIALSADISVPERINKDELKGFDISTKNLNGEFEAATGTVIVTGLKTPNRTFRKRYWTQPDQFLFTKEEFYKNFPYDSYKDEYEMHNWEKGKQVFSQSFDTGKNKTLSVPANDFSSGVYLLTMNTKDKYGQTIEVKKYFTLYNATAKAAPANHIEFYTQNKTSFEPGETLEFNLTTAEDQLKVLFEIVEKGKIIKRKWLDVNQSIKEQIVINESHRGNFHYMLSYVKNNRFYQKPVTVSVPWSNKLLNIEYATFRNKLYPGQDEEWQIKISGPKKDKVAAELLTTMYDASLDEFSVNAWNLNLFPFDYRQIYPRTNNFRSQSATVLTNAWNENFRPGYRQYQFLEMELNAYGRALYGKTATVSSDEIRSMPRKKMSAIKAETAGVSSMEDSAAPPPPAPMAADADFDSMVVGDVAQDSGAEGNDKDKSSTAPPIRKNLKETVFFFPELKTDAEGNVIVKFKMNEALTSWKFLGLAHTKDLQIGITENEVKTQKDLMVMPNPPRFFREGDKIEFTAKVSNLTEKVMDGTAEIKLFDAVTMQPVNDLLGIGKAFVPFKAEPGQSARLAWNLDIPFGKVNAITHQVIAKSGNFSDGEESSLPVLTNRMLVTESKPLPVRGNENKDFTFLRLQNASGSSSLQHHKMTLEFTSNPAWYAVQALPYLMEYPYDCTEQIFSRYYANTLASSVANAHPKVKTIFEKWKGTDALESNLSKNQELKSVLLEETPWVLDAQNEAQQKKNIGLLFDLQRMSDEQAQAIATISERQMGDGGFSWFPGGRDSWYITQYIVEGMGHLNELGVKSVLADQNTNALIEKAVGYIDGKLLENYKDLQDRVKRNKGNMEDDHLDNMATHYLYARSFFPQWSLKDGTQKAKDYYLGQAEKYWNKRGVYEQGMMGLALHREKKNSTANLIVKSLKERSLNHEELGMYWKYNTGYYWYQLPIETHSLMIELFDEVANDKKAVDDLKVWLLKNKQTTNWKTTKATASAVYALLRRGANWLLEDKLVNITIGNHTIDQSKMDTEAGTGYFKTSWDGDDVDVSMANIKVKNPNSVVAWGAVYWQYFEDLDKITSFEETPLTLKKQLFKEVSSDTGPKMIPIAENSEINPGDKLKVRIELRVDRTMEYVHMKDMRASGFEPINVISRYKWQDGLGYYESTKDASTNFFFDYLPKGTYVFEYPLRVIHNGDFSNGVTTIQCMYAPEFTSHSEGIRVKVKGE